MTVRAARRAQAADADGALVRMLVGRGHWAEQLPPVPDGHTVTVALSSSAAVAEHGDALALIGYTVAGVTPTGDSEDVAGFVVSQALLERHPHFWRSLAGQADRVYRLALGPVLALLADELRVHRHATGILGPCGDC